MAGQVAIPAAVGQAPGAPAGPPAGQLPVWDWQFWAVTLIAGLAAAWIISKLTPRRLLGRRRRGGAKRATLTVGGRPVEPARKRSDCH